MRIGRKSVGLSPTRPWNVEIKARLEELREKLFQLQIWTGLWRILGLGALALLPLGLLEWLFHFPPTVRLLMLGAYLFYAILLLAIFFLAPVIRQIFRPKKLDDLALLWGRSLERMNDRLLNAMQVWERRQEDQTSPDLAALALQTVGEEIRGASYERVLDRRPLRRSRKWAGYALSLWAGGILISQGALVSALGRMLQPTRDFGPAAPFSITIENLPAVAIRGEPIEVVVQRRMRENLEIVAPRVATLHVQERNAEPANFNLKFDSVGQGKQTLDNPQNDLRLWATAGAIHSDTVRVRVQARPFIKDLQVRWFPPAYSKLPSGSAQEKRGDVTALKGSRVRIHLEADRDLGEAWFIRYSDEQPDQPNKEKLDVTGNEAQVEFTLLESGHYNLLLTDREGIPSAKPVDYSLWPIQDESPSVEILYPPADAEINESMVIPVKGQARDDFAISNVRLGYKILKNANADSTPLEANFTWRSWPFEALGEGNFIVDQLWNLNDLNLLPGDEILYRLSAMDNDQITGPKSALSSLQKLRFPSLEEIFTRLEGDQNQQMENVQETIDQSKALKKELEELKEELKRNPDLPWEERKKVEDLVKKQEEMVRQVSEMSQTAEQMIQQMEENRLLSTETMEKFQELQKLLAEVMSPELLQAMQKLQDALQKQDPEALRRASEEFSLNQEEFLKKLEKTLNILKQLQMEMKLDQLAKMADDLLQKQSEINQQLEQAKEPGTYPQEALEEAQLQKEMEAFEREFQEAKEALKESPFNPEQSLQEAEQLLQEIQFPENMEQMSGDMQQGAKAPAQQKGAKIQSGLAQLSESMKRAKKQMMEASKGELAEALKKVSHDLLELSYKQEDLLNTSNAMDKASPRFRQQAQEQQGLKNHLEKTAQELFQLAQKSFFITPQIGAAIDQAFQGMEQALNGYTARSPQSVSQQQQHAMGGLNRAVMEIGQSLDQLGSSSSSTGFSEMMEQLSQMAGQQGQINQGTMALIPGGTNPGSMSLEQQAALSRLAAEQEALRQEMESWNQANQQTSQMMGRLGELGKEMQEVVKDLKERNVDERTLKRQEQILTRLLDAQRSVREREYKKERISRTATGPYYHPAPTTVDQNLKPDEIREKLLRALQEGYTRDYQQLIRDYFEALGREKN